VYVRAGIDGGRAAYPVLFLSSASNDLGIDRDPDALLHSSRKPAKIADFLHTQSRRKVDAPCASSPATQAVDVRPTASSRTNRTQKIFFNSTLGTTVTRCDRDSKRANRGKRFGRRPSRRTCFDVGGRGGRGRSRGGGGGEATATPLAGGGVGSGGSKPAQARAPPPAPGQYRYCGVATATPRPAPRLALEARCGVHAGPPRPRGHAPSLDFRSSLTAWGFALPPEAFIT
jgi:hypothetical protein